MRTPPQHPDIRKAAPNTSHGRKLRSPVVLVAALLLAGCSGSGTDQAGSADHNEADITFAQDMIPHHKQAVEMSDLLLAKDGVPPGVASLAADIKAAQQPEIAEMTGWLQDWQAAMTHDTHTSGRMDHGEMDEGVMKEGDMSHDGMDHGMATVDQLAALAGASAGQASRLYLNQMIAHHLGAIDMAQTQIDQGRSLAAVELARSVARTQQAEVTTMEDLLLK